jgi:hypothetical protein
VIRVLGVGMRIGRRRVLGREVLFSSALFLLVAFHLNPSRAQDDDRVEPGHAIGTVSTHDNLIVMELDEGALGKANLFDLAGKTVRFSPERSGYRVERARCNGILTSARRSHREQK